MTKNGAPSRLKACRDRAGKQRGRRDYLDVIPPPDPDRQGPGVTVFSAGIGGGPTELIPKLVLPVDPGQNPTESDRVPVVGAAGRRCQSPKSSFDLIGLGSHPRTE